MKRGLALAVFGVVFAAVYFYSFATALTWFRYYPLTGDITTADLPRTAGPAMGWYAWIVQGFAAGLFAALLTLLIPPRLSERAWTGLGWFGALVIIVYTFYFEWHWFLGN